jgi:alpha-ketoglutarate-dependent taurine dioxygenase
MVMISPCSGNSHSAVGVSQFLEWHAENNDWFEDVTNIYGGILFRGFNISTAQDFDEVIWTFHQDMVAEPYLGTTPRFPINGTKFIQSASEAPKFVSIPTHIELSFFKSPPKRIYFYASEVNPPPGGHTPLTDFRAVWEGLSKDLKEKMLHKGLLYHRWYRHEKNRPMDPLVHKTWQAMFLTSDKEAIVRRAYEQGFNASWDEYDDLLLQHEAVITRTHSVTGKDFWCTHFNVLHASTVAVPYAWDAQILRSKVSALVAMLFHVVVQGRHALGYHYGANVLYLDDGSEFSWDEAMHIREVISRNTWMFAYEKNDMVMLDNHRIAHGRTPWFQGARSVMVAYK